MALSKGLETPGLEGADALGEKAEEPEQVAVRQSLLGRQTRTALSPSAPAESPAKRKTIYRALRLPAFKFSSPNLFSTTTGYLESTVSGHTRTLVPFPNLPLYWP